MVESEGIFCSKMTVYGNGFLDSVTLFLRRCCSQGNVATSQATDHPCYSDSVTMQNARALRS